MFYQNGELRFTCTGCGACCTGGTDHYVAITAEEREAIRGFLGLTAVWFQRRYLERVDDATVGIRLGGDGRCPFLGDDNRCQIYPVRPTQCRTYPWWPELIDTKRNWFNEGKRCEGINRGEVVSLAVIEHALMRGRPPHK